MVRKGEWLRALSTMLLMGLGACGGSGGGSTPTGTPTPVTVTYSGTARATGTNSCSGGDVHDFTSADGPVSVTLVQSSDAAGLSVQVCSGNDNNMCTINQMRIAVGQTLNGTRRGTASQTLKFLPLSCTFGGSTIPVVTYTATVSHLR